VRSVFFADAADSPIRGSFLGTRTADGVTSYFLTDALGSTIALSDSTGGVTTSYSYSAFGYTIAGGQSSDNPYQYAGMELVENSFGTLYYDHARYLDTFEFLRFLTRDPRGLSSGSYSSLFSYVGNSPTNGTDPTGMFAPFGFSGPQGAWLNALGQPNAAAQVEAATVGASLSSGASTGNGGGPQTATGSTSAGSSARAQAVANAEVAAAVARAGAALSALPGAGPIFEIETELILEGELPGTRGVASIATGLASSTAVETVVGGESLLGADLTTAEIFGAALEGAEVGAALGPGGAVVSFVAVGATVAIVAYVTAPDVAATSPSP
jgi:RHS repeat-associated protein